MSRACRKSAKRTAAEKMCVKVTGIYWTFGPFDAPDDETATAAMLNLSSHGNVHPTTVRPCDSAEIEKVVGLLSKK
jgi:uncharacterized protein with GYD domain